MDRSRHVWASRPSGKILSELVIVLVLISGMPRNVHNKQVVLLSTVLVVATISARWLYVLQPGLIMLSLANLLTAMTLALMAGVILIHEFGPGPIDVDRIVGGVTVYIVVALIWAQGIVRWSPSAQEGPAASFCFDTS